MSTGQKLLFGFALGGILTLLLHPGSSRLMVYSATASDLQEVFRSHPYLQQPLELSPIPKSQNLLSMYADAQRVARRLLEIQPVPTPQDWKIAEDFFTWATVADPDNALWSQLSAAVLSRRKNPAALEQWHRAAKKTRWQTGQEELCSMLWQDIGAAEGSIMAWQGVLALTLCREDAARFIAAQCEPLSISSLRARYDGLLNCGMIFATAKSFQSGRAAGELANYLVFNGKPPAGRAALKQTEETRASLLGVIGRTFGSDAAQIALRQIHRLDSWENYLQPAQVEAASQLRRTKAQAILTATLPSALLAGTLVLGVFAAIGAALSRAFGRTIHANSAVVYAVGGAASVALFLQTGAPLLGVWSLVITAIVGAPVDVAKALPLELSKLERMLLHSLGIAILGLFAAALIARSVPAKYLAVGITSQPFGYLALLAATFAIPFGALAGRSRSRPVLFSVGQAVQRVGLAGACVGMLLTVVAAPFCMYLDSENRAFVKSWIENEPQTFRAGEP